MIELTTMAAKEVERWRASHAGKGSYLRIEVKRGGCSGLYYYLWMGEPREDDRHYRSRGIDILVDPVSDGYLQGLKVDYAEDLMGGGFRYSNPEAKNPCGCGLSFDYPDFSI